MAVPWQHSHPVDGQEHIGPALQLLCDALQQAGIRRVYELPPVFLASTYDDAELMMEIFMEFYQSTKGSLGPVGFDTKTTSNLLTKEQRQKEVSLIQLATRDICVIFQIYNIMGLKKKLTLPFPPKLKAFLEDPDQLMCSVGTDSKSKSLRKDYSVYCDGLVELSEMAAERNIPRRSLEALDVMYGHPGREVTATKKILRWDWDKESLQEQWVWYAAKEAFAGLAIYENMLSGILKSERSPSEKPQEKLQPMSKEEMMVDILLFLAKTDGRDIGKPFSMRVMTSAVFSQYPRLKKLYQGPQREKMARRHVMSLIRAGKIVITKREKYHGSDPTKNVSLRDTVMIPKVMHVLRTLEGIRVTSPFFNGRTLAPGGLAKRGVTTTAVEYQGDQDLSDLRMFLEFSVLWDRPLIFKDLVDYYIQSMPKQLKTFGGRRSMSKRQETPAEASASSPSTHLFTMSSSVMIRSFARTPLRNAALQLRRGGHAEGYNQPTGYLFGEKPLPAGTKRVKEDWENLFFYGFFGAMAVGGVLVYYKPDTNLHTWAYREAKARMEARGEPVEYKQKE
ncbi:hypothetical protein EMPS_02216 [Entomortierella parvispora]|uniref:NADH dehydrogenase [ubiquinone] 1 beta subcomplex subunit 11, mitochondrial n=1 Tax=Entomortierella parvispora TaxID=205924 RepID=A0A9P3H4F5_9FUNG|nr:hypothetical protein EMPS_02216 [Entomortierella parvispora]